MQGLLSFGLLIVLLLGCLGNAQDTDNGASTSSRADSARAVQPTIKASTTVSVTSALGNGTCASRTANYITHTLPQQCLRTNRVAPIANVTTSSVSQVKPSGDYTDSVLPISILRCAADNASSTEDAAATSTQSEEVRSGSTTATQPGATGSATSVGQETETDSPLDNANFLSFEEWKKENKIKIEREQVRNGPANDERQRPGINNALDGFGEEGEIEIDFLGFGGSRSSATDGQEANRGSDTTVSDHSAPTSQNARSKDAGKTCKERTNYASFDCAATVLKNNPECSSVSSILVENKDSYMLNTCSAKNKFFIVELCNDILIDTVVLANYEFFSSIFRHFRVSVSDRYPVKMDKWIDLGTFEARNTREVQAFLIEHPKIWAKVMRIEFLTHYGSEYYCPVSLLRVHGTTMLQEYRSQEEVGRGERAADDVTLEAEVTGTPIVSQEPRSSSYETEKDTMEAITSVDAASSQTTNVASAEPAVLVEVVSGSTSLPATPTHMSSSVQNGTSIADIFARNATDMTCSPNLTTDSHETKDPDKDSVSMSIEHGLKSTGVVSETTIHPEGSQLVSFNAKAHRSSSDSTSTEGLLADKTEASRPNDTNVTSIVETSASKPVLNSSITSTTAAMQKNISPSTSIRSATTTSLSTQPQPSTQESFFKSISKRLSQLESNSTLSLQYIEEQSRILRDAFSKVEKRQITSTSNFLTNLNETVMKELHGFRQAYDQLWQSTVIELDGQREQHQREMVALSARLGMVADELVWQKRMGIVQSTLLLLCLGFVLFARSGSQGYLEVPLMQQVMNKSSAALSRAGWESPPASPSPEGRSPVSLFRRKLWRSVTEPGAVGGHAADDTPTDSRPETREGPDVHVLPPTPPNDVVESTELSNGTAPCLEDDADDEDDVLDFREARSGPATPTGTRERYKDDLDSPPDLSDGMAFEV